MFGLFLFVFTLLSPLTTHATLLRQADLVRDTLTGLDWEYSGPSGAVLPEDLIGFRYATTAEVATLFNTYVLSQPCGNFFDSPCATPEAYANVLGVREAFAGDVPLLNAIYDPNTDFSPSLRLSVHDGVVFFDKQNIGPPPIHGDIGMLLISETSPVPEPGTVIFILWGLTGFFGYYWWRGREQT